jgi:hypothetical protein
MDISTYDSYCNPQKLNRTVTSVEMLERAKMNKEKMARIDEFSSDRKEKGDFWSGLANIFNPFKCDKK